MKINKVLVSVLLVAMLALAVASQISQQTTAINLQEDKLSIKGVGE